MAKAVVYDIEALPNCFTAVFVDHNISEDLIEEFKRKDIYDEDTVTFFKEEIEGFICVLHPSVDCLDNLTKFRNYVNQLTVIAGYNNLQYDDILLFNILAKYNKYKAMIRNNRTLDMLLDIKEMSDNIINADKFIFTDEKKVYKYYKNRPISIDLQKINHLDVSFTSLKHCQVILKWHNIKEFELPPINETDAHYYTVLVDVNHGKWVRESLALHPDKIESFKCEVWDRFITDEYLKDLVYYNINDTMSTLALFNFTKPEIVQRANITNKYNINVLSLSRSATGEKLISNFYLSKTGETYREVKDRIQDDFIVPLEPLLDPAIKFNEPILKDLVVKIKRNIIGMSAKLKEEFIYAGNKFSVGLGGLHTIDRPGLLISNDKFIYRDADATSYYPRTIVNRRFCPRHLDANIFLEILEDLLNQRVYAKANRYTKDGELIEEYETVNQALKIVINAVYGKTNDKNSLLRDPAVTYGTTINNQLYILKLIEMLVEGGFKVVSANTDGVVSKVLYSKEDEYYAICKEWETLFNHELEYTDYAKYIRVDVNNYMSIKTNGKVKGKGRLLYEVDLAKGYRYPVIAKAVTAYFKDGINAHKFIREHTDILDFCMSMKVGGQYNVKEVEIEDNAIGYKTKTKTNRYYVSTHGTVLIKEYKDKKGQENLVAGEYVTVLNKLTPSTNYHIKYGYYYKEVDKIIDAVLGRAVKIVRKRTEISGTMFDELEDF